MTAGGETSKYHYSGDKVIYVTNGSNNITAEYSYDSQGNPATMTYNNVTYYYHLDGHGNVTAMTDAAGNTVAEYSYDAWGKILSQSGSMAAINPFRYAGYRYDEATGLYYLMARYYDPGVGRFITRDTFHGFEDESQSLNQYAYCGNNPVMRIDPSGHIWNFKEPWNSVNNIGFSIDAAAFVIGSIAGIVGIVGIVGTVREIFRKNTKGLVLQVTRKLLLKAGLSATGLIVNMIVGGLTIFLDLSIGKAIARVWDRFDSKRYNNL